MVRILAIALIFIPLFVANAQVKVDATPTGQHAKVVKTAKQTREEARQRKEQAKRLKEQLKAQKKAKKLYRNQYDSVRSQRMDSLRIQVLTEEDSLAIANEVINQTHFPSEYKELLLNPVSMKEDARRKYDLDSVAIKKGEKLVEQVAREYLPDELNGANDPLADLQNPIGGTNKVDGKRPANQVNPNFIQPKRAQTLLKQVDMQQFEKFQTGIQKLKRKYSDLPDTRYPKEGTKRNSLEDKPFKKRIHLGGNFSLQSTDPVIVNTSLQLGYWIHKKWLAGVGVTLREQFSNDKNLMITGDGHGYSFFTRYDIPKGFFAWAEVERQVNRSLFHDTQEGGTKTWESAYLAGVGREFSLGFVQMTSMVLYDFNYQNNALNARPLVFKLGVRISPKPRTSIK